MAALVGVAVTVSLVGAGGRAGMADTGRCVWSWAFPQAEVRILSAA